MLSGIVTNPNFKQITQNKDRISDRILHVTLPYFKCGNLLFL